MYYKIIITLKKKEKKKLAKLGDGLDESPAVMVGDNNNKHNNSVKIGA